MNQLRNLIITRRSTSQDRKFGIRQIFKICMNIYLPKNLMEVNTAKNSKFSTSINPRNSTITKQLTVIKH